MRGYTRKPHAWQALSRKSPTCQWCGEVKNHPLHQKGEPKIGVAEAAWVEGSDGVTARLSRDGKHIEIAPTVDTSIVLARLTPEKAQRLIDDENLANPVPE